jgi:hypothetical protein
MGKLDKDNKGFGGIELLMLIVIVILLGVVGWYVYKDHNKATTTKVVTVTKSITKTVPSISSSTATAPSYLTLSLPSYMGVKETAIKFQLSSAISDAYAVNNGSMINISVHSLDNVSGCVANSTINSGGIVALAYDAGQGSKSGFASDPNAVEIGKDWFELRVSDEGPSCSSTDSVTQAQITSITNAFLVASKTIVVAD